MSTPSRVVSMPCTRYCRWACRSAFIALAATYAVVACADTDARTHAAAPEKLVDALSRHVRGSRLEARFSIDGVDGECVIPAAQPGAVPRVECGSPGGRLPARVLLQLAARADSVVRRGVSADPLHALALIALMSPHERPRGLTQAVDNLRLAAALDSTGSALTDLAGVYIVRAVRRDAPEELLKALETADLALVTRPRDTRALYNRALALDLLGTGDQASRAWALSLRYDSLTGWSRLARARRALPEGKRLNGPSTLISREELLAFARREPLQARVLGWERWLAEWGRAVSSGDTVEARAILNRVAALAEGLVARGRAGDQTLSDAVEVIEHHQNNEGALRRLALAHAAFGAGVAAFDSLEFAVAERCFARAALPGTPQPLADWATILLAGTRVNLGRMREAEGALRDAIARADTVRWPALAARSRWMLGTLKLRTGRRVESLSEFATAARLFERIGEEELLGAVEYLQAEAYYHLGRRSDFFTTAYRALSRLRNHRSSVWLHNLLFVIARAAAADRQLHAALELQEEGLAVADRRGQPAYIAEARLARAGILASIGRYAEADSDRAIARTAISRLPTGLAYRYFNSNLRYELAANWTGEPGHALSALDSLVDLFAGLNSSVRLLSVLVERAQIRLAMGQIRSATSDLDRAAELLGRQRADFMASPLHASLRDTTSRAFDHLVMHHVRSGRARAALQYYERARAVLSPVRSPSPADGARYIAAAGGGMIVDYGLIGDTLLTWTIDGERVRLSRGLVAHDSIATLRERITTALQLRVDERVYHDDLVRLYDWLIRPIESRVAAAAGGITIVADDSVAELPFAALYDSTKRQHLVEKVTIRFAPTVSDAERSAVSRGGDSSEVLVVTDPVFDRSEFPDLRPLSGAASEGQAIARLYRSSTHLHGNLATPTRVRWLLPRARIFHFAGHAVFDDEHPERSLLVLSSDSLQTALRAETIARLDLEHVRLVVLSACETNRGVAARFGGFSGLTTAFLAAGARGVVGSTWQVDDQLTRPLMLELHRAYQAGEDAASALRRAQVRLLHGADSSFRSPAAWAGFRYVGS